jgi:hypothetical protein
MKSTAGTLNSVFAEVAKNYSNVDGIGEAAAWNSFENRLYIYEGDVEFSLTDFSLIINVLWYCFLTASHWFILTPEENCSCRRNSQLLGYHSALARFPRACKDLSN